jgi:hypothetical protein
MYVHLLEIVYSVENRASVEEYLAQEDMGGAIISIERYGDEILAILADTEELDGAYERIRQYAAISSCEAKRCALYRITTCAPSAHVLCAFPFKAGEEWYIGSQSVVYLSLRSHVLSNKQLYWLLENPGIVGWDDDFPLSPVLEMQQA